jgi:hypothetical protein
VLERRGWSLLRVQGSHYIYGKQGSNDAAVGASARKRALKDRLAETLDEDGRANRRRSLNFLTTTGKSKLLPRKPGRGCVHPESLHDGR